jgi:hypothetical protein
LALRGAAGHIHARSHGDYSVAAQCDYRFVLELLRYLDTPVLELCVPGINEAFCIERKGE